VAQLPRDSPLHPRLAKALLGAAIVVLLAVRHGGALAAAASEPAPVTVLAPSYDPVVFEEVAEKAGVRFVVNPSRTPQKHQPETMISGVALFDFDNDGFLDLFVVNGATMPGLQKTGPEYWNRLYRNNRDGTFTDVTEAAGLAKRDAEYGTLWGVAAAFADYDRDGWLDLFVSNYCVWDPQSEQACTDPKGREYCHPDYYRGLPNSLFHNNHDGTFSDVSQASGIRRHVGKGMGIGVADFDGDGFVDFFVSNDTLPAFLFMNQRDGTFLEKSTAAGVAFTELGRPISGMGADARDLDNDGLPDIFQTALANEDFPLYRNLGGATFEEATGRTGVSALARPRAGWANGIYDLNNDGLKDLFVACSSVMDPAGRFRGKVLMPNAVLIQTKNGRFVDGSPTAGAAFARQAVHRGAAFGDIDNDGRVDVVVTALEAPLEIWHNLSPAPNHWLTVLTIGTRSNRDGQGVKLRAVTAAGAQYNAVNTAVGYGDSSDRRAHFGLGPARVVSELTLTWPSGVVQILKDVPADQVLTVREPPIAADDPGRR
jgi:hypothetical protein